MSNLPIKLVCNKQEFSSTINTKDIVEISNINLETNFSIQYSNDIAIITLKINPTKLSLNNIKKISNSKLRTLEDYKFASKKYLICFCTMILDKIPIDWTTFKNYLTCQVPFENSLINVNINTKEEYKPDKNYEFAINKYINLYNKEPNIKWSDSYNELNTLDLKFSGNISLT